MKYEEFKKLLKSTPKGQPITLTEKLILENSPDIELPDNLTVMGPVFLNGSKLSKLPKNFVVHGSLYADRSAITRIPKSLVVHGDAHFTRLHIKEMPSTCMFLDSVSFENSTIDKMPAVIISRKSIDFSGVRADRFPETVHCQELKMLDTMLKVDLQVVHGLTALMTNSFENFSVPKTLSLQRLNIRGSEVSSLPPGIRCQKLDISRTDIAELPGDLEVGRELVADNTKLRRISEKFSNLSRLSLCNNADLLFEAAQHSYKNLSVKNTTFRQFPKNLTVQQNLLLAYSELLEIPADLTVYEVLDISNSAVQKIHDGTTINGILIVDNTGLKVLPENLVLDRTLDLSKTPLVSLPENLRVLDTLILNDRIRVLPKNVSASSIEAPGFVFQLQHEDPNVIQQVHPNVILIKDLQVDTLVTHSQTLPRAQEDACLSLAISKMTEKDLPILQKIILEKIEHQHILDEGTKKLHELTKRSSERLTKRI